MRLVRFVVGVWVASRAFFMVTGALGSALVINAWHANVFRFTPPGTLSYWATWDGAWYEDIVRHGYADTTSTAFFPLYPLLVRGGTELGLPPAVSGIVISLTAFAAALYFFHALALDYVGPRAAEAATLGLAFFPTAFYFNAVYTESLFLALTTGALWALRIRGNVVVAAVLGYFASATRNAGVLILLPLADELWRRRRQLAWDDVALVALVPGGLLAYMLFLWQRWRDALLFSFVERQSWGRSLVDPGETLASAWRTARDAAPTFADLPGMFAGTQSNPALIGSNTNNLIFFGLAVVLVAAAVIRLPLPLALYAAAIVALPLLTPVPGFPLMGFPRYVLLAFPLFFVLGEALARSRILLAAWLAVSAAYGAYLTVLFVTWRWVA